MLEGLHFAVAANVALVHKVLEMSNYGHKVIPSK